MIDIEVGTQRAMVNMIASGAGVGIVDPDIISDMDSELITSRPLSPPLVWALAVVSPKKGTMSTITRSFVDWIERRVLLQ